MPANQCRSFQIVFREHEFIPDAHLLCILYRHQFKCGNSIDFIGYSNRKGYRFCQTAGGFYSTDLALRLGQCKMSRCFQLSQCFQAATRLQVSFCIKRVFDLVIDFGTSQSPKSTRPLTTYWCPSRPGHPALRNNFASSLLLRTWLPYDWTPRSEAYFVFPLAQGTPGKQCGLAATGDYQPSLRSPWLAAHEN